MNPTMMLKALMIAAAGLVAAAAESKAATLLVDDAGRLLGANGVDVQGALFDVRFVDGTCVALFDGCDDSADFAFGNPSGSADEANAAAAALLSQVLVDGPQGSFRSDPTLINGCAEGPSCLIVIPFDLAAQLRAVVAFSNFGLVIESSLPADLDLTPQTDEGAAVFAAFSPSAAVSEVPVPAALPLFLAGLAGLSLAGRRRAGREKTSGFPRH